MILGNSWKREGRRGTCRVCGSHEMASFGVVVVGVIVQAVGLVQA